MNITIVLGILLVISITANGIALRVHKEDAVKIASLESSLKAQEELGNRLRDSLQNAQLTIKDQNDTLRKLEIDYQRSFSELDSYKKRQNVVLKRPKLIEKMANKATKNVFESLSKVTGGNL